MIKPNKSQTEISQAG